MRTETELMTETGADRDQEQEQDDGGETVKSKIRGDVDRASGGEFMPKYNDDDVLELLASAAPEPLSAPEVADEVGCSRGTARNKLDSFVDEGIVATKKLGARSRGYWLTDTGVESLGVAVY
jgi:biotin operon repressor